MHQQIAGSFIVVLNALLKNRFARPFSKPLYVPFVDSYGSPFFYGVGCQPFAIGFCKFCLDIWKIVSIGLQGFTDFLRCLFMETLDPAYRKLFIVFLSFNVEEMEDVFLQWIFQSDNLNLKGGGRP